MNTQTLKYGLIILLVSASLGCSEDLPKGDPSSSVTTGRFGLRTDSGIAVGFDMKPHFLKMLVSGYAPIDEAKPKSVESVDEMQNCIFPRPDSLSKIYLLSSHNHRTHAGVYTFGQNSVQEQAQKYVNEWRSNGYEPRPPTETDNHRMEVTNVIVTDTAQPVHIVLGSHSKVIYNFHVAPGVKISGVSLISASNSGVANLPKDVPLTVMPPVMALSCNAIPRHKPQPHWQLAKLAKDGEDFAKKGLERHLESYRRFSRYFQTNFGVESETRMIGGETISHFLVGPAPSNLASRVPYNNLQGAVVRMGRTEFTVIGGHSEYRKRFGEEVRRAAEQLVPGSLASLNRK